MKDDDDRNERHLKQLNDIDNGRRVTLAWDVFRQLFDKKRTETCALIVTGFRSGKTPQEIYNSVAMLTALDDLEASVRGAIDKGNRSGKDLLNGGPNSKHN